MASIADLQAALVASLGRGVASGQMAISQAAERAAEALLTAVEGEGGGGRSGTIPQGDPTA